MPPTKGTPKHQIQCDSCDCTLSYSVGIEIHACPFCGSTEFHRLGPQDLAVEARKRFHLVRNEGQ